MTKSGREIVEIFEAYDLTGTAWSAAQLAGCDAKTVARYVAVREAGGDPLAKTARPQMRSMAIPIPYGTHNGRMPTRSTRMKSSFS